MKLSECTQEDLTALADAGYITVAQYLEITSEREARTGAVSGQPRPDHAGPGHCRLPALCGVGSRI